ncbi:DUF6276 family protein [Natrononativus amylolyticus]|uniref:DUF6276 family protein n=1 Tax=Natrononativus amylolyticus TaxID=2963434 RepID=UPI0020CEEA66|nr:DUF6276 family protein [Natrononativus amylolyticus]
MSCPACGEVRVVFPVPERYREYAPDGASVATICPRCLVVDVPGDDELEGAPAAGEPKSDPEFDRLGDAFPTRPNRAIPLALAIGLSSSLATNRAAIAALLEETERAGADPLLALDRLLAEPTVEPAVDLERRRHQFEQLLY